VCSDAERRFPGVLTAPTKQAIDRYAAGSLSCQKAQALIRERAQAAVEAVRSGHLKPFLFETPVTIEVDFKATSSAHMTSLIPGVERAGPRAIVIASDDYLIAFRTLVVAALFGSHTSMGKLQIKVQCRLAGNRGEWLKAHVQIGGVLAENDVRTDGAGSIYTDERKAPLQRHFPRRGFTAARRAPEGWRWVPAPP
jgi:D-aminopeptidase